MIFLFVEKINETKAEVTSTVHQPNDEKYGVRDIDLDKGIFVESELKPQPVRGKRPIHYINPTTKEQWFEYVDRDLIPEEVLQDTINALGQSIAEEKIKSIQKDALISSLGQELTKVKLEIMQLKGGV